MRTYSGDGTKGYRSWSKEMGRIGRILEADQGRMRTVALQTLQGQAADFIRFLGEHPAATWDQCFVCLLEFNVSLSQ